MKYAFQVGAVAFFLGVLWTVVTTDEYPPEDMAAFDRMKRERRGLAAGVQEIVAAVREMPLTMKQLAVVQFFTWLGLFCMWLFYVPAVARHVFGAVDAQSEIYTRGVEWGTFTFSIYSIVCFLVAFALPRFAAATSRKTVHATALLCGSAGLLSCMSSVSRGCSCSRCAAWASCGKSSRRSRSGRSSGPPSVKATRMHRSTSCSSAEAVSRWRRCSCPGCTTPSLSRSPP